LHSVVQIVKSNYSISSDNGLGPVYLADDLKELSHYLNRSFKFTMIHIEDGKDHDLKSITGQSCCVRTHEARVVETPGFHNNEGLFEDVVLTKLNVGPLKELVSAHASKLSEKPLRC
jgi:hypothetical protein